MLVTYFLQFIQASDVPGFMSRKGIKSGNSFANGESDLVVHAQATRGFSLNSL